MLKEQFHLILDKFTEYITDGSENLVFKDPATIRRKKNTPLEDQRDAAKPEKGHTVVLSHKPQQVPCEWCDDQCSGRKAYSRSPGSQIWTGKCRDCGEKRQFLPKSEQDK